MYFLRPDAATAFQDRGVKKALGRYVQVSTNQKPARFMISKTIPISVDLDARDEALLKAHDEALDGYGDAAKRLTKIDGLAFKSPSLLDLKAELARRILESCHFCERSCGVDRTAGEKGFCNLDGTSRLSSEFRHMGEEACLVPSHTIFFIGCSFYCVFCQNWTISRHREAGTPVTGKMLSEFVKKRRLFDRSRNVNLVGGEPTPNTHTILDMLKELDVNVPVIWNSNMYMHEDTMNLLDGVIDVYLTDFKYGNDKCARRLSKCDNYWDVTTRNHLLAKQRAELLIRHLVMPDHLECCTKPIIEWIAANFDNEVRVNVMSQYRPEFEAFKHDDTKRVIRSSEMKRAYEIAKENGLTNLD
jgi:putative pyruvate formate lyase activating enzyme